MSTLGSLMSLLGDTGIKPYNEQELTENRIRFGTTQNQTQLLELADLKRKQAAEQEMMAAIQQNPALAQQLFGGPVLGSLQTAPGGVGTAPMTQQTTMPGQPPGAPQVVPGGQDLSQFATQGGPPQSTLASLGPQPQAPPPAPRNPLLEMAATNPQAAFMLQKQMQAQQDLQWKNEERRLDMGVKIAAGVAQELNAVKDQATLDAARERIRLYHPQAAAQIPQFYSKEALEPLIMKGVAVEKLAEWRKDMATARQTEMMTERLPQVFGALQQFATGGGGTQEAPPGTTTNGAAPPPSRPSGRSGQAPQESEHTRLIRAEAIRQDVDPDLAVAVATQESYLNPNASGDGGKSLGYFQLQEGAAKDVGIDPAKRGEPALNIQGGVAYLKRKLAQAGGDVDKALRFYNGGGDPNYVSNVRRFLPGAQGTTGGIAGTGTAQAPQTDPKIAGLEARIKRGQALALELSAQPGMAPAAAMVNQQVNDLQKERDRLDAPRQEFLKKQAVQGLELEQKEREGLARAQLEADTKPATNAEIDAINRALPREKQLSYGTTYKEIREKKLVGGAPLDTKITEGLTATTTAIQQFEELSNAVTALPTGPLTQYVEQFKERWGIDISDEKVAQRAILAGAKNQLLAARSGGSVTAGEEQRLLNELPNEANDPKVFKARLANTVRQFKNLYKTKVQILRKTGHAIPDDLMEPLPAPEAPPAPKVSSNVDKFKGIKP